jgi:PhoH-like ATPase
MVKAEKSEKVAVVKETAAASKKKNTARSTKAGIRRDRIFVLDTNVLLHSSDAIFAFSGVVVLIPLAVLEELDTFKSESGERGRNAREVSRTLDQLRAKGPLYEGVPLDEENDGSIVRVMPSAAGLESEVCGASVDNQIIQLIQKLVKEGNTVTFVTKDINARIKADALGIDAEDFVKGVITKDDFYKGWIRSAMPALDLKQLTEKKIVGMSELQELNVNEFVIFESERNQENYRLFRYLGGSAFKEVMQPHLQWNFSAKNVQQLMALDLLLDDAVKLVTFMGPAGTGKTFLTLLAGLYKVLKERVYRRFLVSRPIVALGADIGYLPGDVQEKLFHWMQPVYDNLEFIFGQMGHGAASTGLFDHDDKSHKKNKKHQHQKDDSHKHDEKKERHLNTRADIERLQQRGLLSLEAITYMRGRSIPYQFVFIDEVQNLTPHEVKTIVSRAGEGTKVILAGDPYQIDSLYLDFTSNGLTVTSEKCKDQAIAGTVFLETSERSELAKIAISVL